jgi:hypothetical protein
VIGAGTFINPLIKIVTTVAILAAVYFFFVKPALDTTENVSNSVNESIGDTFDQVNRATDNAFNNPEVRRAQKLGQCVTKAGGDVDRINRCHEKFSP